MYRMFKFNTLNTKQLIFSLCLFLMSVCWGWGYRFCILFNDFPTDFWNCFGSVVFLYFNYEINFANN